MTGSGPILRLGECGGAGLAEIGGKALNLDALWCSGFPVPSGFVITTAAYAAAVARAGAGVLIDRLAASRGDGGPEVAVVAAAIRSSLAEVDLGADLSAAIREAYADLGSGALVAVRSSATAEDLAQASFAGQQDTFLDVAGIDAVIAAVAACWASLWTDRAVLYRFQAGVDQARVELAVVVQTMAPARAAGVMFTADPISGSRRRMVIDAVRGRGELVVSGRHDAEHYVIARENGHRLVEGATSANAPALADADLARLTAMGVAIERCFGAPQDVEFVFDPAGRLWITQTRPITTLFPLPAASADGGTRVYYSATADEGVTRPITPMGLQAFRIMAAAAADIFRRAPSEDRLRGPGFVVEAGLRTFYDVTPLVRSAMVRRFVARFLSAFDAHTAAILQDLFQRPELSPTRDSLWRILPALLRQAWPLALVSRLLRAVADPAGARARGQSALHAILERARLDPAAHPEVLLEQVKTVIWEGARAMPRHAMLEAAAGAVALGAARSVLGGALSDDEAQTLLSGVETSVTVQLNLELWALSRTLDSDAASKEALAGAPARALAEVFAKGRLPPNLQEGLADFLSHWGHRAVFEVDLGLARWSEDPAHVLASLGNYLRGGDKGPDPVSLHAQAAAAAAAAEAMVLSRVGPARRAVARPLLRRARMLWGLREQWKDDLSRVWAAARGLLLSIGGVLAATGRLDSPGDVVFLDLGELDELLRDGRRDPRGLIRERRTAYVAELGRRHVPSIMLSDGTDLSTAGETPPGAGDLVGVGASPGRARGPARVLLDPVGAAVEPGEILVAPSTDPGWTPLFLTAAGLVMEKGAAMSHGAVIAREFGIPAVVAVSGATRAIRDGQVLDIDGATGRVTRLS